MLEVDVLVVGGGPAGLCAAARAAHYGAKVLLVDENQQPGGQLFKQIHKFFGSKDHQAGVRGFDIGRRLLRECSDYGVITLLETVAYGIFPTGVGLISQGTKRFQVSAKKIILACGAAENALTFPGWTLPGVMTAGAAQTMVNIHQVAVGERVLIIGSGNVGLIVAYQLLLAGIKVVAVLEILPQISGYGVHAAKLRRKGIPIYCSSTILAAQGIEQVVSAIIAKVDNHYRPLSGTEMEVKTDTICLAVGLTPLAELAMSAGCKMTYNTALGGYVPLHTDLLETSVPGVFVAGDIAGVEEASTAMEEGKLAGTAAAASLDLPESGKAELELENLRKSLRALRTGPFGLKRALAKQEIEDQGVSGVLAEEGLHG
jgi:thioredoxin reductase